MFSWGKKRSQESEPAKADPQKEAEIGTEAFPLLLPVDDPITDVKTSSHGHMADDQTEFETLQRESPPPGFSSSIDPDDQWIQPSHDIPFNVLHSSERGLRSLDEDHDNDDESEPFRTSFQALQKKYQNLHTVKMDLLVKLKARDKYIQQLHTQNQEDVGGDTYPNVTRSLSADGVPSPDDPRAEVVQLRELTEKEATLGQLQTQLNLAHAATVSELKTQKERELGEIETENARLHQRLEQLSDSKEVVEKKYCSMVERLRSLDHMKQIIEDVRSQASTLTTITAANNKRIEELKNDVEVRRQQALQYKEDFERERKDREEAAGRHVEEIAGLQLICQKLREERQNRQEAFQKIQLAFKEEINTLKQEIVHWQLSCENVVDEHHSDQEVFQKTQAVMELQIQKYQKEVRKKDEELESEKAKAGDELAPYKLNFQDPLPASRKVGSGCYGTVYAVEIDRVQCIAKRVQDILLGERGQETVGGDQRRAIQKKFRQECILLSKIRHPNIVQFMGVRYGRDMYDLTLVMERLPMDLQKCLEGCHVESDMFFIPLSIKFSVLVDVTYGLLHLHNRSILHRDLTAGNILLTSNLRAKIADLGVSRIVESRHSQQLTTLPGTIGYMPPEAVQDKPEYNLKLDVFSFGVLALFVAIQEFPKYSHERVPDAIAIKGECELYKRRKWITKIGEHHSLYPLIHQCLQDNSTARPSTTELNAMMKELSGQFPRQLQDIGAVLTQLNRLGMPVTL